MKKVYFLLLSISLLLGNSVFSQKWVQMMQDPYANFYDVQQEFKNYWKEKGYDDDVRVENEALGESKKDSKMEGESERPGWAVFKRWEYFMEPRVYPSGNLLNPIKSWNEHQGLRSRSKLQFTSMGNWTSLGASTVPSNGGGAGRVNCVRFDPGNPNVIYVGTASGGLWKSNDGGASWSTNTDNLASLGVSDLAIDPTNPNIMYLATGDSEGGGRQNNPYSIGLLKSTDGGATWNSTGLNLDVTLTRTISRVLIDPNNTSILLAAASDGIYRSIDGGVTWSIVLMQLGIQDMEFKPGDPTTIYATNNNFFKSIDGGVSFTNITSGLPLASSVRRFTIAVTPADPNYVYIIAGSSASNGFYGLYRSTDNGTSFTLRSNSPNLLGWSSIGNDVGGQSFFTLSIAVSPTNKNVILAGGVNIWRSTDGGVNWNINAHWRGTGAPYVHADIHALEFIPGVGTTYFTGTDGGIFKSTNSGTTWEDLSNGLQIAQMYRLGGSATHPDIILQGWQDNGTNRYNPASSMGTWSHVIGGDGMECFIDWSNSNYMYGEYQRGNFLRSTNGGASFSDINNGLTESGSWVTPWMMSPTNSQTLYAGLTNVWKSTNRGTNWIRKGTLSGNGKVIALALAASDSNVIYAAKSNNIYKTTNGGSSWVNINNGSLPLGTNSITYIAVHDQDANKLWVTFSGYNASNKVFNSIDGGATWTNISSSLPNLPVNCIVYQNGSNDGIYVGTDVGVYYKDNALTSWQPFFTGLPNVVVDELEIHYGVSKIRAATYGRGLWESDLYTPPIPTIKKEEFKVFPNPNQGQFTLFFIKPNKNNYKIELTNVLGQVMFKETLNDFSGEYSRSIDLTKFGKGIYLITLSDSENKSVKKVLVY